MTDDESPIATLEPHDAHIGEFSTAESGSDDESMCSECQERCDSPGMCYRCQCALQILDLL